jgi:hypothetical protein
VGAHPQARDRLAATSGSRVGRPGNGHDGVVIPEYGHIARGMPLVLVPAEGLLRGPVKKTTQPKGTRRTIPEPEMSIGRPPPAG